MKRILCFSIALSLLAPAAFADTITPFNAVTINNSDTANIFLVDLTYGGNTYTAGQFVFGTTTRFYNLTAGGQAPWLPELSVFPADGTQLSGGAKSGDVGSKADNGNWTLAGANDMSSNDGLPFQQTIFSSPVSAIFVFERGGNDTGTIQPIMDLAGSLGGPVTLTSGSSYADTLVSVGGQNAKGYVYAAGAPIFGIQINSNGHDALSILSVIPEPTTLGLLGLGLGGFFLARRRK